MQPRNLNNRRDERVSATLPVDLGGTKGITRDVSATGMFFEVDASYTLGSSIIFTVELDSPTGKMIMNCQGEIVRIEPHGKQVGVAVKILESSMVVSDTH